MQKKQKRIKRLQRLGFVTILSFFLGMFCRTGMALDIVKKGKAVSTIVIPVNAVYWTKEAAGWVKEYVKKATGAELKIVEEGSGPKPKGTIISVGHTKMAKKSGIKLKDLKI